MTKTLLDSGDGKHPVSGTRIVLAKGDLAGEAAHVTGISGYWSTMSGSVVYEFTTEEGEQLCGARPTFIISPYQDEALEAVPNV